MYNLNHSRSKFQVGNHVKVAFNSGVDSGREATVIKHFTPRDKYVGRLKNERDWVPIQFKDGNKETDYMAQGRLIKVARTVSFGNGYHTENGVYYPYLTINGDKHYISLQGTQVSFTEESEVIEFLKEY